MKKHILIFSLAYFPKVGGAEVAIKEITTRIPNIEFDMVTLRFSKDDPKEEKVGNVNVYRIGGGWRYLSKILFVFQAARFAKKLDKKKGYDASWAMMTYMSIPAKLFGKSYLLTLQDGDPFEHVFNRIQILPAKPFLISSIRKAKKIQAISNYLGGWAKKLGYRGEVEVVPNGVDIQRFFGVSERQIGTTLITTSRLVEKNAVGDIISAMQFLPENVSLQILGRGPLEKQLKEKAKKFSERVKFFGEISQEELPKYLHGADIFVRPSLSEGQGISFIEAMATGLPIIATSVGGIPDFLRDGDETGLFCKVHDPQSIADCVQKLIANPDLASKIRANALQMVRTKYDWNLIAEKMNQIFNEL